MKNNRHLNKFLLYSFCYLFILCLLTGFFYFLVELSPEELLVTAPDNSIHRAAQIIYNNTKNFLGYLILFVLFPINVFWDLVFTSWSIAVSFHAQGVSGTFEHLFLHGIIELPNAMMYTYLSANAFIRLCKDKDFGISQYWQYISERKQYYFMSFLLIIIAGLVEGLFS